VAGITVEQTTGWADELRLGLIGQTRRVWAPVGVKVVQPLQYERQWCYLVLVVDPRTGRLWWSWTLDMTAPSIASAVALWRDTGIDAVVWDRAPAHQTAAVKGEGVTLVEQPPYSPELNPAERVFEAVRLHIEGKVYATLPDKYAAVHAFLTELDADPDRVRSLAGWEWITAALVALPTAQQIAA
jgi:DDE superfamily endonuclease